MSLNVSPSNTICNKSSFLIFVVVTLILVTFLLWAFHAYSGMDSIHIDQSTLIEEMLHWCLKGISTIVLAAIIDVLIYMAVRYVDRKTQRNHNGCIDESDSRIKCDEREKRKNIAHHTANTNEYDYAKSITGKTNQISAETMQKIAQRYVGTKANDITSKRGFIVMPKTNSNRTNKKTPDEHNCNVVEYKTIDEYNVT